MKQSIRVGTRKSLLAMAQTKIVIEAAKTKHRELDFEIVPIATKGDLILERPLLEFGGKGVFIHELEHALRKGEIDIAVHSAKDMPMELLEGLTILAALKREDPRDVLVTRKAFPLSLKEKPVIGTGSLRRQQQLKKLYPVLCGGIRGNVPTRLNALKTGAFDGIMLAAAGLIRLRLDQERDYDYEYFNPETIVPAAGQGIIAVEGREEGMIREIFSSVNDKDACLNLETERHVLKQLNAGCNEPVGVYSAVDGKKIKLTVWCGFGEREIKIEDTDFIENHLKLANCMSELVMQERKAL